MKPKFTLFINNTRIDGELHKKRVCKISNGTISTLFESSFQKPPLPSNPNGIAVTENNEIVFSDTANNTIRKISVNGEISTIAGNKNGYSVFENFVYVGPGGSITRNLPNGDGAYPYTIAITSNNDIIFSELYNHRIRKISSNGIISTIAGTGIQGYSGDGDLAIHAKLSYPIGITLTSNNEILIVENGNHIIRKISSNGIISTIAGNGTRGYSGDVGLAIHAKLSYPIGICHTSNNEILFTDSGNNRIRKISSNGIISTIAGTGIEGYSGDGDLATKSNLYSPRGITINSNNEIFFTDTLNNRIRKISSTGIISTIAGTGFRSYGGDGDLAVGAHLNSPFGLLITPNNEILFTDNGNHRVRKIARDGTISTIVGDNSNLPEKLMFPKGIAITPKEIFICDSGNHLIRAITYNDTESIRLASTSRISMANKCFCHFLASVICVAFFLGL